ncbi:MAG: DNA primase noncatalytic subunit PriX [Nitrososphaerota archaeon]|nr:DNA primase noncatalytic subunit PriX [Nitrososphaerota archaeon]
MSTASFSTYELARYPFIPSAEGYLKEVGFTLEDAATPSILGRAKERVLAAIERRKISLNLSDIDREIISFYVSLLIVRATGSGWLARIYAKAEGDRSSEAFKDEKDAAVCRIVNQLFEMNLQQVDKLPWQMNTNYMKIAFVAPLPVYLKVSSKLEQIDNPNLALIENVVDRGKIYLTRERVLELVEGQFSALILGRIRSLKTPPSLPKDMKSIVDEISARIPKPRRPDISKFQYIEKLLKVNVQDGRHRILWLILPPYLVNVKHLSDDEAMDAIKAYMERVGWKESRADRIIRYNIKRARRIGLMPPTLERLEQTSPGLYKIIVESISGVS